MKKKNKIKNPKAITEAQVRSAVQKKAQRLQAELRRNPKNSLTSQRLADFRKTHASKLKEE